MSYNEKQPVTSLSGLSSKGDIITHDGTNVGVFTRGADDDAITAKAAETYGLTWTTLGASGEANTASNQGADGVGVYDTKVGVDLQFRNVAPGSAKITTTLNIKDIDIDVDLTEKWEFLSGGGLGDYTDPAHIDLYVGDSADYGLVQIGKSVFGRTSRVTGVLDLDGTVVLSNQGTPATSNILFAMMDGTNSIRFALPQSGVGNATYNPRSLLIAGPAPVDDTCVTVGYWQGTGIFDNLACDTSGSGADLGVQNDLEVEGDIFTDSIKESTTAAGVTIDGLLVKDGVIPASGVGVTGSVVGTTDTQTLTNKNLLSTTNRLRLQKGITIESPTTSENLTIFFVNRAVTLTQVRAVLRGTTPSVTYQVKHGTDRSAAGSNGTTSAAVTSTTTGTDATLSTTAVAANSWVWVVTTATSGTVDAIAIFLEYTED